MLFIQHLYSLVMLFVQHLYSLVMLFVQHLYSLVMLFVQHLYSLVMLFVHHLYSLVMLFVHGLQTNCILPASRPSVLLSSSPWTPTDGRTDGRTGHDGTSSVRNHGLPGCPRLLMLTSG